MNLYTELKRRNVLRVGTAYVFFAWLVIQVAETIFPLYGFDDTPARIVTTALAIGIVPVVIFAWAFELTPEGLKKEKDVDRSQSITTQTGKRLDRAIMVALALALAYFAFDKFVLEPQREAEMMAQEAQRVEVARQEGRTEALIEDYGDKSIAVLPFRDLSPQGDQVYLSDGIAEELLVRLTKLPELRVISNVSAFSFKGKNIPLPSIAEQLKVAHILEGSVRSFDERIRVTAQLIDARTDTKLWSQTYDRPFSDVFAIQDDISTRVVKELKVKLLNKGRHWNVEKDLDPEAYRYWLQIKDYATHEVRSAEKNHTLVAMYHKLVEMAPDFAPAWAYLGGLYASQWGSSLQNEFLTAVPNAQALAHQYLDHALQLDPELVLAHQNKSILALTESRLDEAARELQTAVTLDPRNISVLRTVCHFLTNLGRFDEVPPILEYLRERDPLNPMVYWTIGLTNGYANRDLDVFMINMRKSHDLDPNPYKKALLLYGPALRNPSPQVIEDLEALGRHLMTIPPLAYTYQQLGMDAELQGLLDSISKAPADPQLMTRTYAMLGRTEQAFEWLDRWWQESGGSQVWSEERWYPFYWSIENDPRWLEFLEKAGVSDEQLAAIPFEFNWDPGQ